MIQFPKYEYNVPEKKSPFELYQDAVNRCDDPKKSSLKKIEASIKEDYDEYEKEFNRNNVHIIDKHGIGAPESEHLKSLYTSKSAIAKILKSDFDGRMTNRSYSHKCPYCTFGESNTLEHILPKTPYPEYAINALNLIPCCSQCNSYKGEKVKDVNGIPETINFYYHNPDSFKFLYVDFMLDENGFPLFSYRLSFPGNCDAFFKRMIENHFNNLHLIERYNEQAISIYSSIEILIACSDVTQTAEGAISFIKSYLEKQRAVLGQNHYNVALLSCLTQSQNFHKYLTEKLNP